MYSDPIAYFITFHTYGTWLHGDDRGSVDRHHNTFGNMTLPPDAKKSASEQALLKGDFLILNESRRENVGKTIRAVCDFKGWHVLALNVRTNHVHIVISAESTPERVMNTLKSWATRRLTEAGLIQHGQKVWTRHGSTRYIWDQKSIEAAIAYTLTGQGTFLPGSSIQAKPKRPIPSEPPSEPRP